MDLRLIKDLPLHDLVTLYDAVGWHAYTKDPRSLVEAVRNSTYVVSLWEEGQLVGLARGLSDDVSIFYLQDVLVHPAWQDQGLGRRMVEQCLQRFAHVRQKVLLTDNENRQRHFYTSLGFQDVAGVPLTAFVCLETGMMA